MDDRTATGLIRAFGLDGAVSECEHRRITTKPMAATPRKQRPKPRTKQRRISVLIADDHPVFRQGLIDAIKNRPELTLAGQADNGKSALAEIQRLEPDVAVLDMKMPGLDGMDVVRALAG